MRRVFSVAAGRCQCQAPAVVMVRQAAVQQRSVVRIPSYKGPIPTGETVDDSMSADGNKALANVETEAFSELPFVTDVVTARKYRDAERVRRAASLDARITEAEQNEDCWRFHVKVTDAHDLPVPSPPSVNSTMELKELLPTLMTNPYQEFLAENRITRLTPTQSAVIPWIVEGRDVLCVAPTGSGKTLAYLVPPIARILAKKEASQLGYEADPSDGWVIMQQARDLVKELKEARETTCRLCGQDMRVVKVCPETGATHAVPQKATVLGRTSASNAAPTTHTAVSPTQRKQLSRIIAAPSIIVLTLRFELIEQVSATAKKLAPGLKVASLYVTQSEEIGAQMRKDCEDCDILVATPNKLARTALTGHLITFRGVKTIVLDEFDEMFSRDGAEAVDALLRSLPKSARNRPQRLLFGATLPRVVRQYMKEPILSDNHRKVQGTALEEGHVSRKSNTTHHVILLSNEEKLSRLVALYSENRLNKKETALIFVNKRSDVFRVQEYLERAVTGLRVGAVTGTMSEDRRASTIRAINAGTRDVLVCTDVCARGIDFTGLSSVVHFDMPVVWENYSHRTGRVGRRGIKGQCFTFFTPKDLEHAKSLVRLLKEFKQHIPSKLQSYAEMTPKQISKEFVRPLGIKSRVRRDDPAKGSTFLGSALSHHVTEGEMKQSRNNAMKQSSPDQFHRKH